MPLLPSEYTRKDLQKIVRDESATTARRSEQGHDWAAGQHQDNADEARHMISARHYGRNSRKHTWR
ncbi:hypothetical protein [Nonomuraea sp. LPB2021202275-12-8]|uniref:hypothetical protein n=1 Tax=Nonomuraea sp. LPB2021202275-12-8 TaxID=3120159 RepID=UPI00300D6EAF